jgi:hypothetical protein
MVEWFETKFGLAPYKEVQVVKFSFDLPSQEETAFKQYKLLLDNGVIQGHLEFSTKKGIIILEESIGAQTTLEKELGTVTIESTEKVQYEKVLESNNQFSH